MKSWQILALVSVLFPLTGQLCAPPPPDDSDGEPVDMFAVSNQCTSCHDNLADEEDNDVSIGRHWRSVMMANAARDPYWQAKVSSEALRTPSLASTIEDVCAKCHMPMARTQAVADGTSTAVLASGFLDPAHDLYDLAIDGVSCTVCHQIQPERLGDVTSFSGGYVIDAETAKPDRVTFGPFADPVTAEMQAVSEFTAEFAEHISEPELCAVCHTLFTPAVDANGTPIGTFPEQTPYLEWLNSDYSDGVGTDRTCQDCHMPDAIGGVAVSTVPVDLPERSPFAQHHFVGGNFLMLRILQANRTSLGIAASDAELQATLERTVAQLETRTADIAITSATRSGGTLTTNVTVTNYAGHKFPTGFPSRRAWVHLTVSDASDAVVFESGAPQPDGTITGNDTNDNPQTYEPHRGRITAAGQVQIYQSVMRNDEGDLTHTLLRAFEYVKDNRLLPAGFDKTIADEAIAPVGQAADDDDFIGGSDRVQYVIDTTGYQAPFTVSAELLFQSIGDDFVDTLRADGTELTEQFVNLFDAADRAPVTVAADEAVAE